MYCLIYYQTLMFLRSIFLCQALLWRVLTQLLSGLRVVHGKNMALRIVSPVHVLLTSGTMVRFNCVGIPDVLEFESRKTLTELQIDDLIKLGKNVSARGRSHLLPSTLLTLLVKVSDLL